jgi:hypothetical protein
MVIPLAFELTFQARIASSSKAINRMKINLRKVSQTFGDGLNRVLGRSTSSHPFEVSWPTEVVKTLECGETIDRRLEIVNPHERLQAHPSTGDGISWPQDVIKNLGLPQQEHLPVLNATTRGAGATVRLVAQPEPGVPVEPGAQDVQAHPTAHTASMHEFTTDQRDAWRNGPRKPAKVSHIRRATPIPCLCKPHQSSHVHLEPEVSPIQAPVPAPINPQEQNIRSAPVETSTERHPLPRDDRNDPTTSAAIDPVASIPPESSRRPEVVVPNPIAVKKEEWRLSAEAAAITDSVRVDKGYPLHGTPFHGLSPLKQVIDPEILQKMTEIRLRDKEERDAEVQRKVDEKKRILRDGGTLVQDEHTLKKMDEIRKVSLIIALT